MLNCVTVMLYCIILKSMCHGQQIQFCQILYIKKSFFLHLWCILNVFKAEALGDHPPQRFEWGGITMHIPQGPSF